MCRRPLRAAVQSATDTMQSAIICNQQFVEFEMSYQVIARKWRPQRFDDVVGQQAVTRTLRNALTSGRLAQAFVFAGPRGVGKTTTARILARALNCVNGPTRRSVRRRATPASRSPKGATSTCSRSTRRRTPASTTSAR